MSLKSTQDDGGAMNKCGGDWEAVAADRWRTSFRTLPMTYPPKADPTTKKWHRPCHRSFLFYNPHSKRGQEESTSEPDFFLNPDLPGVRAALDSVTVYEEAVGFHFEQFPSLGLNVSEPIDLTSPIDEKELVVNKIKWDEMLDDLMNADSDESLESSYIGSISSTDLHRSTSTVSSADFTFSDGSIDSTGMPSTPRPKAAYNEIQIKGTSPKSMEYRLQPLSPTRALNASASSFVPAFPPPYDEEPTNIPSKDTRTPSSEFSFTAFTFPTLNSHTPNALKVKKDDLEVQSDSSSKPASDLLPPFFQEAPQRTRIRKSRTREIVDRLRSQITPSDILSAQPPASVATLSEGAGDRAETSTPPNADDDGWIDASASTLISPSKTKRARELLLALARRRTDSLTSEGVREIMEAQSGLDSPGSQEMTFSPSPSPSPPLVMPKDDGWKENDANQTKTSEPSKKAKQASWHNAREAAQNSTPVVTRTKKLSSNSSRTSAAASSSSAHSHPHSHPHTQLHPHPHRSTNTNVHHPHHPMQQSHQHHFPSQQGPYAVPIPHHPSAAATPAGYPAHPAQMVPAPPGTTAVPYFFPQYPAAVPMSLPYGAYLQPHYPMGVGVGVGIAMHAGGATTLVNPIMAAAGAHGVQYALMPGTQLVAGAALPRLGLGGGGGAQAPLQKAPSPNPNMGAHSYRQTLKHAAAAAAASPSW